MKFLRVMKWFREISVLAEDEQRRWRHPEIDVEHLLLALVGIGGPVSHALAQRGVTLDAAREACETTHRQRVARLGVTLPPSETAPRIPDDPGRGEFRYRHGVRPMLERAATAPRPDVALFSALLKEPSGRISEVLSALDLDPESLEFGDAEQPPPEARFTYRRFVAAPPEQVWALLSDPKRWLEWNDVTHARAEVDSSGTVHASPRGKADTGTEHTLRVTEPSRSLTWETAFVRDGKRISQRMGIDIDVAPRQTGSDVLLTLGRTERQGGWGLRGWLMRPIARLVAPFLVRGHLRGRADNISRALRSSARPAVGHESRGKTHPSTAEDRRG